MLDTAIIIGNLLAFLLLIFIVFYGLMIYGVLLDIKSSIKKINTFESHKQEPVTDHKKIDKVQQSVGEAKISSLPPEVLAPAILRPPKPMGGFGAKQ